ncbi:hypothetical protein K2Q00_03145 [Patescibacteria group bacterium]|nr:hypothetical protein [Patescibacteria group bacterium]
MSDFFIDFPTAAKYNEFCADWTKIGVTVKKYDPKSLVIVVGSQEESEPAVDCLVRFLSEYGLVLRCQ